MFSGGSDSTKDRNYLVVDNNGNLGVIEYGNSFHYNSLKRTESIIELERNIVASNANIEEVFVKNRKIYIEWEKSSEVKCAVTNKISTEAIIIPVIDVSGSMYGEIRLVK